jgi:hypothetical protein
MTEKEARQFINLDQFDSIEEAVEELVFPIKSFLLTSPILKKTFFSKLKKLAHISEACEAIKGESTKNNEKIEPIFIPHKEILSTFVEYEQAISKHYLAISSTNEPREIMESCEQLLHTHATYVAFWNECQLNTPSGILLSKPLDRMAFYSELNNLHVKNIRTIAEIIKSESELSHDFKIEVERVRQSMT